MYFYYYVLIRAILLAISSAESPFNPALQNYFQKVSPLLDMYNSVQIYKTSAPHVYYYKKTYEKPYIAELPTNKIKIQYAPLSLRTQKQSSSEVLALQKEFETGEGYKDVKYSSNYDNATVFKREGIRHKYYFPLPMVSTEKSNSSPRKYIPGYNVDLHAVNNKLMQNGIYANNANLLVKNKQVNENYLQSQTNQQHHHQDPLVPQINNVKSYSISTYHYFQQVQNDDNNVLTEPEQSTDRLQFYVKAPEVTLNLAHARHIAGAENKASVKVNSKFRRLPSNPQEFFSNQKNVQWSKTVEQPNKLEIF